VADRFCCLRCRLLQEPASTCEECASPLIGSLANERDVLKYRAADVVSETRRRSGWKEAAGVVGILGAYAGIIAGGALWWPIVPIVLGGGAGIGGTVAFLRRTGPIAGVPRLPPELGPGATTRIGTARKLAETITALDSSTVLVEEAAITGRGGTLVWQRRAVPFLVELAAGERLVIAGLVRLTDAKPAGSISRRDPRLASFGVPDSLALAGALEVATVRDGDPVQISGEVTVEVVPELAFHRDAGEAQVMRGALGSVVVISDPDRS
jgi:hypothetical protein